MTRVRVGESKPDWAPKQPTVNANKLGIADLMREFAENAKELKVKAARQEEIKAALKRFGTDFEIEVDGEARWRVRKDGAFMPKQFKLAYPATYADYEVMVRKSVFDVERFAADQPMLYTEFRAQRLEEITS